MQNLTSKWKSLNKNGLKLSLVCGLNWFISFVAKSQFYLFSSALLGLMMSLLPRDYREVTIDIIIFLVLAKVILNLAQGMFLQDLNRLKLSLTELILFLVFMSQADYTRHHAISKQMLNNLLSFWIVGTIFASLVKIFQPRLFEHYLFKKVINKEYLGIRKTTDELPLQSNFYVDADEKDADKRMKMINQHVIKKPYQGVVELSFLNREVITGIGYEAVPFEKKKERSFVDVDTIYYLVFGVYPFGIIGAFGHPLIEFKLSLSRRDAFTKNGEGLLKKDF